MKRALSLGTEAAHTTASSLQCHTCSNTGRSYTDERPALTFAEERHALLHTQYRPLPHRNWRLRHGVPRRSGNVWLDARGEVRVLHLLRAWRCLRLVSA